MASVAQMNRPASDASLKYAITFHQNLNKMELQTKSHFAVDALRYAPI